MTNLLVDATRVAIMTNLLIDTTRVAIARFATLNRNDIIPYSSNCIQLLLNKQIGNFVEKLPYKLRDNILNL